MKIKAITAAFLSAFVMFGCTDDSVSIHAEFTTDKDVYELNEDIYLTNTSWAENARVISSKWEWDGKKMWGHQPEEPISFDRTGEFEIRLTVTTDIGNKASTCIRTVKVQDTNVRPIADFSYTPTEGIKAGDKVTFTDKSTDPDGSIVSWEWKFGTTVINEQNPEFEFTEAGEIPVSLTVTDNMKGKATKTVTISVAKSAFSLELLWATAYDSDPEAFVKAASPAVSPDGKTIYAFSSGLHLAALDTDGKMLWSFDANKHNPSPYTNSGDKRGNSCTPAVDKDGTIYIAVAYNERDAKLTTVESGVYGVNPDGSQKWYFPYGNARYIAVIPVVFDDRIVLTTKNNPTKAQYPDLWSSLGNLDNGHVLDKNGRFIQMLQVKQGNYGGAIGLKDGTFITHCNAKYGSRVFFNEGGKLKYYGQADNKSSKSLGYFSGSKDLETGDSGQMAVGADGRVYILYENVTGRVSKSYGSVLYCYDIKTYVKDASTAFEPVWAVGINGKLQRYNGLGVVLGADGTIYATTGSTDDTKARVTAVNPDGSVKWESAADGNISGTAAVDNENYIYYLDYTTGKLVKLAADTGKKVSEIQLGEDMRSSPTISADGTIYCTGMKDGLVTLFAVKGSATGYADSWSQSGGNPQKTCVLY